MAEFKIEAELKLDFQCISLRLSEGEAGALALALRNIDAPDIKHIRSLLLDAVGTAREIQDPRNHNINHLGDRLLGICDCESCLDREMDKM